MELTLTLSFIAGLVSFLSPCILPLVPGLLAYLAGSTVADSSAKRKEIFIATVFFVLGFASVFSVLGVLLNTILTNIAYDVQVWLARVGGVLIILFGLYLVGLLKLSFLDREYKLQISRRFSSRYLTSFVFGAAFAAGWTPCVGAVLGGILTLAAASPGSAFVLLFSYSLGLGLPFLVVGLFTSQASQFINKYAHVLVCASKIFGLVLIVLGILVFTQRLAWIANLEIVERILLRF